ncbi:uncharacterized protein LOC132563249 [Ylistrum balloti]|uniref:uncharacterized protein LOC132563249 n=1 Tax=Ylistrum balloti TaxID=509963 RepID=UPI002905CDFD|nr:uncharacterized protein LOC132563249 [Ylistrum balloti]
MVFDKDSADRSGPVQQCSSCGSTKTKHFSYLPIGPRIARIFGDENLAKLVQVHGPKYQNDSEVMWDIHDSQARKNIYSTDGYFKGDFRGLSFAFEADGVSPYHNVGVRYSMTPIMLTLLNLPRHIRNNFGNILLVRIIPGSNRSEASKLDPYIEIMVDELLYLTECSTVDTYRKAPVEIKIKLLVYILDYPGLSKLFCQHGSASLSGCHWCHIRGKFCKTLDKVIYLSNRSYLSAKDSLRMDTEHFVDKTPDQSVPPKKRQSSEENDYRTAYCRANKKVNRTLIAAATGYKSPYALGTLPGHCRLEESLPDAMHTIKDVVHNIMNLLVNKGVAIDKIQLTELNYGRNFYEKETAEQQAIACNGACTEMEHETTKDCVTTTRTEEMGCSTTAQKKMRRTQNPSVKPRCTYVLSSDDIKLADERACSLRVPLGFRLKPSPFIFKNRSALKSHDYKQIASHGILKYCLRGCLSERCRSSFFSLLDSISNICSESIQLDNLDEMEYNLNRSLALMERDFPVSLQNITTHIMHHIVKGIKQFGPIYGTWMFTFERFNSWICRRVFNKRHPETTVMETYTLFEWCNFMISTNIMPSEMKSLWCASEFNNQDDLEQEKDVGREVVLSKREMNSFHQAVNKDRKCLIV